MRYVFCALLIILQGCASTLLVDYRVGNETGKALVCGPEGKGLFPAVIYNHGLIVERVGYLDATARGYDLDGFCHALAKDGFLAFFPSEAPVLEKFQLTGKRFHEQSIT